MRIPVRLLKLLYCLCRQAERSVDFALQYENGLDRLRCYYTERRRLLLDEALATLAASSDSADDGSALRPTFASTAIIGHPLRLLLLPIGILMGWRWFSRNETRYMRSTLTLFKGVLRSSAPSAPPELIRLRMDLYSVQVSLRSGVLISSQLEALAQKTEHFGQNDTKEFAAIEDLLAE